MQARAVATSPLGLSRERLARALGALYARVPLGMRLGLDAMRAACKEAGHPERAFEVVHVAGTNGKGSTCAMIESIARASGKKTGLYTSPHLCRFAERIRIDGEPIDDAALTEVLEEALRIGPDLSFFETATLAAFLAFRAHGVELAVIEVGIGGRLDATNVVPPPRATAITRVAFDHMDKLGNTLAEIAAEKAGIAKRGSPLVVGRMPEEARAIIDEIARAEGAPIVSAQTREEHLFCALFGLHTQLGGAYQGPNLEVAWLLGEVLGIGEEIRETGLATARWPGRFEHLVTSSGAYLLDGAHNPDGAEGLKTSLSMARMPIVPTSPGVGSLAHYPKVALVFGAMADKAWPEVLDTIAPLAEDRVYVAPAGRAAAQPDMLAARHAGVTAASVGDALVRARELAGPEGLVLVTGSLYLVGEARAKILDLPTDPPVAL
ncbi:Dihydrofolate synthase [Labilithrix luteola]|uniref:Dihydrofolate synthase/folylpolyglutamate synthase n=1 Tax=Labilithrix luteola TaxID=1391654 RepID=A0A0K1Q6U9_9BACT|nr:folylpolyglutamate synthase/dihydrofolate synthase family protein [Labilithrix luteola]AKV01130.1 Dihydrofolate synthase [Labilithrix luteola]